MVLYLCHLTLHDNVFFASREMGTLYETEKYLHNWALSYALFEGTYIPRPYRLEGAIAQRPGYLEADNEQNLLSLNESGIYVFPALPIRYSYQVNTFKVSQAAYHEKSRPLGGKGNDRNYPLSYGRAKELAVGSTYKTYIIAPEIVQIPRWIRLGKWAAKIRVETKLIPEVRINQESGDYTCQHPLNPIDLPSSTRLLSYNRIVMPPVSLLSQAQLSGDYWKIDRPLEHEVPAKWRALEELPNQICLPSGIAYGANYAPALC
ncbi:MULTISPECIES: type I-D CRISPR-associated protein Cas5/Csc1 [Trichocoleus]|uniref:Type I-D CRISPR-associated protein Cas5/Csc1 n=1 Tax=Trichocoleus desertorum GB2-A4 TaxID=2933944 RepID=A0ABV0JC24_9CYAN|nr:type I-D CRISPR-associated protein Cas5/Csc1 [Trichocoleus sp. FACHB-46]MBD1863998.1 type I-D CRISPR-associated protein Cas5/Csc1 [Trichocoleus sp. FACHB-46]